jgi:hypothetical protein
MPDESNSKSLFARVLTWIGGVLTALLATIGGVEWEYSVHKPSEPRAPVVVSAAPVAADVYISYAEFRRSSHRDFLWVVIPYPKEFFSVIRVSLVNQLSTPIPGCYIGYEYGSGGKKLGGESVTFIGKPHEWFESKGSVPWFTLSADRTSEVDCFSMPRKPDIPKPEWLRVRAFNDKGFSTPWYDIDLSKVNWEPDQI